MTIEELTLRRQVGRTFSVAAAQDVDPYEEGFSIDDWVAMTRDNGWRVREVNLSGRVFLPRDMTGLEEIRYFAMLERGYENGPRWTMVATRASGDRCDYAGCLGPVDGSECRHPRPEDGDDGMM